MNNIVTDFLRKVSDTYSTGHAREHSYRPALKEFFEKTTELTVINEPKRSEYGAPDFIFLKGKTVVAYAEAKDIDVSLDEIEKGEQMVRYYGYSNIILTNGLDFRFYRNGVRYGTPAIIGKLHKDTVEYLEESFGLLTDTVEAFIKESKEPIKSGSVLSKVMAGKARRIRDNVKKFLEDEGNQKNENLLSVYKVINRLLIVDLDKQKFADMYAQTIVYGLFVARYYDKSPEDFSRQEARDLVPVSNPFLRHFFDHIAGSSFDPRIDYIVNELCEEFNHADVQAIVHNYYKIDKDSSRDPIIHFYEDFLQEYDSAERKKMGVFYTPLPVVQFIIRSVDNILKNKFELSQGLADTSKVEILKKIQERRHKVPVHRVQVLDPATGTGTFLNETILHIKKSFEGQEGRWQSYVNNDLLSRLHGFELMMASYTIAHLKLSSTLQETGAAIGDARLGVYLTNSLENSDIEEKTLFDIGLGKAITDESTQANKIKNDLPIMVVMGNPPYAGESSNKEYTGHDVYKFEPGTSQKLKERNSKWINDDYVKFIRLAESLIEKTEEGIVGMITAHGYLDNPTFRGMRHHLMETFNEIYVLDLHGNTTKKEKAPNGSKDENVFAIKQGVAIFIGVKCKGKRSDKLAKVFRADFYGKRREKFAYLDSVGIHSDIWKQTTPTAPYYEWVIRDEGARKEYESGFSLLELFPINSVGLATFRDELTVHFDKKSLEAVVDDFRRLEKAELTRKYSLYETRDWNIDVAIKSISEDEAYPTELTYRPFDFRDTLLTKKSKGFIAYSRWETMRHLVNKENLALVVGRQGAAANIDSWDVVFIGNTPVDLNIFRRGGGQTFPLHVYADGGSRVPNLNRDIVKEISNKLGDEPSSEEIFDYVYAVLHSSLYRQKYKEFLKNNFPRVPYPKDKVQFEALAVFGKELRELHLLLSPLVRKFITTYPEGGEDNIEKIRRDGDKIYINNTQYFGGVPAAAWTFSIGGYQPAQKWLKDRVGRILTSAEIEHYQKIITALWETQKTIQKLDSENLLN